MLLQSQRMAYLYMFSTSYPSIVDRNPLGVLEYLTSVTTRSDGYHYKARGSCPVPFPILPRSQDFETRTF